MSEASGGRQVHVCAVFLFLSLDLHSHCLQTANKTPLVVRCLNDFTLKFIPSRKAGVTFRSLGFDWIDYKGNFIGMPFILYLKKSIDHTIL